MSEFFTHVFKINNIKKHYNADTLDIINVYGDPKIKDSGFNVIVRTGDFKIGDLAIFISSDALVPLNHPKFSFLAKPGKTAQEHKIQARRLRGEFSYGLIVPADPDMQEGDDVMEKLGIKKYDISEDPKFDKMDRKSGSRGSDETIAPPVDYLKYDLDGLRKYAGLFKEKEILEDGTCVPADQIVMREKCDGENFSCCWVDGKFYVRSRTMFKKRPQDFKHNFKDQIDRWIKNNKDEELTDEIIENLKLGARKITENVNKFWLAAINMNLEEKTKNHQDLVFFGEKVGHIPAMNYGYSGANPFIYFFDIYNQKTKKFLNELEMRQLFQELDLPMAPIIYEGDFDYAHVVSLAEGQTLVNGQTHIREGGVVRKLTEDPVQIGRNFIRPVLKIVSQTYLNSK